MKNYKDNNNNSNSYFNANFSTNIPSLLCIHLNHNLVTSYMT